MDERIEETKQEPINPNVAAMVAIRAIASVMEGACRQNRNQQQHSQVYIFTPCGCQQHDRTQLEFESAGREMMRRRRRSVKQAINQSMNLGVLGEGGHGFL
jgi:hypothetical protein